MIVLAHFAAQCDFINAIFCPGHPRVDLELGIGPDQIEQIDYVCACAFFPLENTTHLPK